MVKTIFDLVGRAAREGGETVLGLKDLDTHACYMLYGVLQPGEPPRLLKPGVGHEEIICVVAGSLELEHDGQKLVLQAGQAVHLVGEETWRASAPGPLEARYVAAGGHGQGGHGHGHHGHDDHDHHDH
ncbi:hypothetical protein Deba_2273 [Desulfarculus baarsii DSM 2075]|uniref:Cupin 2 conserved barrel domain protein n=1 Tax=Desulfarculus baarsii (strain ATCC 33931 / DSM 2075 / LMG 7858 / VKM B-1802 / 2st14) TaxID=644282 RepID=E1QJ93_DESB2|nr:hypothetical protein [Desulfarculus baarsii]ADK85636.1 hypothetical protein Deba_2273 [Desulfarculus baarsii DSM 2075]